MQQRFLVLLAIFWASAVWAGNNAGGAFTTWPDTGQSKCYNNTVEIPCPAEGQAFHGQDAQYQGPVRSYTKLDGSGNPLPQDVASWVMVRDNVTGLVWEVKENMDNTEDYNNLHDADNRYTWCDTNPDTNGGNQGTCGAHNTEDFINALNNANFGGHTDWRLPTHKELLTLVDYATYNPDINTTFFPNTSVSTVDPDYYWSATTRANYTNYAWCVTFYSDEGYSYNNSHGKSSNYHVRAVRGGTGSAASFTDNGDGTVTDTATGLMWAQASADTDDDGSPDTMTWPGVKTSIWQVIPTGGSPILMSCAPLSMTPYTIRPSIPPFSLIQYRTTGRLLLSRALPTTHGAWGSSTATTTTVISRTMTMTMCVLFVPDSLR